MAKVSAKLYPDMGIDIRDPAGINEKQKTNLANLTPALSDDQESHILSIICRPLVCAFLKTLIIAQSRCYLSSNKFHFNDLPDE